MLPNEHMVTLGMFHIDALPDQHPAGSVIISHHSDLQNGNASARDGMDWEEGHDSSHVCTDASQVSFYAPLTDGEAVNKIPRH